jgi:hypothetical protein
MMAQQMLVKDERDIMSSAENSPISGSPVFMV